MKKRHLSALAALAVTAFFFALAARNVRLDELGRALERARWRWIAPMIASQLLDFYIRAERWKLLLKRAAPRAKTWLLYQLQAIGLALNNVLFMRVGELARAFLAGRELEIPAATALGSVAVERALDLAALLTLFCIAAALKPQFVPLSVRRGGQLALCGVVGALAALAVGEGQVWRLRRWPKLHTLAAQVAEGAAVLREPGAAAAAAAWSLVLWSVDATFYWFGARALRLAAFVSYVRSILVLSWAGAGSALPAAPGGFGTFEAMVKAVVGSFGVEPNSAFAFAVFTHMIGYLATTLIGLAFLYRVGLSLGELTGAVEKLR